jgi:RNA recognition motif-containing protein
MLIEAFQRCGNVVGARVLYDGETGRSRGYGFVCYSTKEEMDQAIETLNGTVNQAPTIPLLFATK